MRGRGSDARPRATGGERQRGPRRRASRDRQERQRGPCGSAAAQVLCRRDERRTSWCAVDSAAPTRHPFFIPLTSRRHTDRTHHAVTQSDSVASQSAPAACEWVCGPTSGRAWYDRDYPRRDRALGFLPAPSSRLRRPSGRHFVALEQLARSLTATPQSPLRQRAPILSPASQEAGKSICRAPGLHLH